MHRTTLKIGGGSLELLELEHEFHYKTNAYDHICSHMQVGTLMMQIDSSDDTTYALLVKITANPHEVFSGKVEVFNTVEMHPYRSIEFEEARVSAYNHFDSTKPIPMIATVYITTKKIIFKGLGWERSNQGWWKDYIPEDASTYPLGTEDPEPTGECTVYFRRTRDYDGSFGFDWLRTGDTDEAGCGWYKDIMSSVDDYDKLSANEYWHFTQPWRLQYGKYKSTATYIIPWVTLMEGCTAKFRVKVCVNEPSGKLRFKVSGSGSQMLLLSYDSAEATTVGDYYIKDLEVKCIGPIGAVSLEVYAGGDLVGKMMFLPNRKMYPVDVAVITVKTREFHSKKLCFRKPDDEVLQGVARLLGQAYIIPNFIHYELDTNEVAEGEMDDSNRKIIHLDTHTGTSKEVRLPPDYEDASLLEILFKNNNDKRIKTNSKEGEGYFHSFHNFLNINLYKEQRKKQNKGKLSDNNIQFEKAYKLYFINEDAAKNTVNGQANSKEKTTIIFRNGYNKTTIAHEFLHCLSLSHTFLDSMDSDKNKRYIFKKHSTDNIMDYDKDGDPADKRKSLWYWQIKQIWKNLE